MRDEGERRARERRAAKIAATMRQGDLVASDGTISLSAGVGGGGCAIGRAYVDHQTPEVHADIEISTRKTCSKCGTWWRPDAAEEAERLKKELLRVTNQVYTPIERLAELAPDEV
jgi:hypothetical protein